MSTIYLETFIKADIRKVFDLARDIDFHSESTSHTNEKAIAGRTTGLIENNETVTFRAKHLGVYQTHTSKIVDMEIPYQFTDYMLKGTFKSLHHQYLFKEVEGGTLMTDILKFESPFGIVGKLFNFFFLKKYMKNFIEHRNALLKEFSER